MIAGHQMPGPEAAQAKRTESEFNEGQTHDYKPHTDSRQPHISLRLVLTSQTRLDSDPRRFGSKYLLSSWKNRSRKI